MKKYQPTLDWIDRQSQDMLDIVIRLTQINSHSFNLIGLREISTEIQTICQIFNEKITIINLDPIEIINSKGEIQNQPLGHAICIEKRPAAQYQVFHMIHMDTVYPHLEPGAEKFYIQNNILRGPGAADAKGGIVVMIKALEALERSPFKNLIGWKLLINPDEEIGSPGTRKILKSLIEGYQIGLVFEPSLLNGDLIGERKGSGNYILVVRGRSAHAGRDHHMGRNAINGLVQCITKINTLNESRSKLMVNVGMIEGGRAVNMVPDVAIARFNIRIEKPEDEFFVKSQLDEIIKGVEKQDGIEVQLYGGVFAPPKLFTEASRLLYEQMRSCGKQLGLTLQWQPSGGVSDGNRLHALGLPNIDTLGVRGADIHSPNEYMFIDSLKERTQLTALFLMMIASGKIEIVVPE